MPRQASGSSPDQPKTDGKFQRIEIAGESSLSAELQQENSRHVEMAWLQENQKFLADQYHGEWIAVDGIELIAHAADLPTLLRMFEEAGHPNPYITAIPSQPIASPSCLMPRVNYSLMESYMSLPNDPIRVGFSSGIPPQFGLLARQDFLQAFHVGFDQPNQQVLLHRLP